MKSYIINSQPRLLKDEAGVKRHIEADDYFGTIATILSLLKQKIKTEPIKEAVIITKTLKNIEKDLMFLQKNCSISYRPKTIRALESKTKTISQKVD